MLSPADLGIALDVAETGASYAENAILKARALAGASGLPALADDSGLEVDALDGFPGIHSARWVAGSDAHRVRALLERLEGVPMAGRSARFRAVVALARPGAGVVGVGVGVTDVETGAGSIEGRVAIVPRGNNGFGYDPVFLVEDGPYRGELTLAELPAAAKDALSHRGRALRAMWPALVQLAGAGVPPPPRCAQPPTSGS